MMCDGCFSIKLWVSTFQDTDVGLVEFVCKIKNNILYTECDLDGAFCIMRLEEERKEGREGLTPDLSDGDTTIYKILKNKFCINSYAKVAVRHSKIGSCMFNLTSG